MGRTNKIPAPDATNDTVSAEECEELICQTEEFAAQMKLILNTKKGNRKSQEIILKTENSINKIEEALGDVLASIKNNDDNLENKERLKKLYNNSKEEFEKNKFELFTILNDTKKIAKKDKVPTQEQREREAGKSLARKLKAKARAQTSAMTA